MQVKKIQVDPVKSSLLSIQIQRFAGRGLVIHRKEEISPFGRNDKSGFSIWFQLVRGKREQAALMHILWGRGRCCVLT